ncbi:prefoldin subunit 1 [Anthonomus grandis grandis]|uniref:prefoldin subunit 1 n=1 Tax=Anthonomus grandis grandis TaxID=2921223 RepID=UPI0021654DF6|nr:prefoldin subunit 1 [Anthonomus grandis grandis]
MSKVDMELKKAFTELQEKKAETGQKLRLATVQIEALKRAKLHASMTEREISALDPETRTYESVGRMFLLTPKEQATENIKKRQSKAEEKIKTLEGQMVYLENSLKEATDSLRELVQQKKDS